MGVPSNWNRTASNDVFRVKMAGEFELTLTGLLHLRQLEFGNGNLEIVTFSN